MSDLKITFTVTQSHEGNLLNSFHSIKKQESAKHSVFQCIGLLYHGLDAANEYDPRFTPALVETFSAALLKFGFPACAPMHMLSTTNWKERMYIVWCFFYKEWQDAATELDYDNFHNYWPSLDFCEPEWDAEVTKWVSSQPYCTYLCE